MSESASTSCSSTESLLLIRSAACPGEADVCECEITPTASSLRWNAAWLGGGEICSSAGCNDARLGRGGIDRLTEGSGTADTVFENTGASDGVTGDIRACEDATRREDVGDAEGSSSARSSPPGGSGIVRLTEGGDPADTALGNIGVSDGVTADSQACGDATHRENVEDAEDSPSGRSSSPGGSGIVRGGGGIDLREATGEVGDRNFDDPAVDGGPGGGGGGIGFLDADDDNRDTLPASPRCSLSKKGIELGSRAGDDVSMWPRVRYGSSDASASSSRVAEELQMMDMGSSGGGGINFLCWEPSDVARTDGNAGR